MVVSVKSKLCKAMRVHELLGKCRPTRSGSFVLTYIRLWLIFLGLTFLNEISELHHGALMCTTVRRELFII